MTRLSNYILSFVVIHHCCLLLLLCRLLKPLSKALKLSASGNSDSDENFLTKFSDAMKAVLDCSISMEGSVTLDQSNYDTMCLRHEVYIKVCSLFLYVAISHECCWCGAVDVVL